MTPDEAEALHNIYVRESGQPLRFQPFAHVTLWYEWKRRGFTEEDLVAVIRHIAVGIRNKESNKRGVTNLRNPGALRLSVLIQPEHFGEELSLATAPLPPRPPSATPPPTPRPASATPPPTPAASNIPPPDFKALRQKIIRPKEQG